MHSARNGGAHKYGPVDRQSIHAQAQRLCKTFAWSPDSHLTHQETIDECVAQSRDHGHTHARVPDTFTAWFASGWVETVWDRYGCNASQSVPATAYSLALALTLTTRT